MSKCVKPLSEKEIVELLNVARTNNKIYNITGALVYSNGNIFQIIEGDRKHLDQLYLNISKDNRHSYLGKLADKEIDKRCFQDWSMAYHCVDSSVYDKIVGLTKIEDMDFSPNAVGKIDSMMLQTLRGFFFK